jgi:hypothetical protein
MSLILVFNKNSPRAHTESELGVLGVHGKLVKYVVQSSKRKIEFFYFSSHKLPKQQSTSFWSQGILGVKGRILYSKYVSFSMKLLKYYNNLTMYGASKKYFKTNAWMNKVFIGGKFSVIHP